MDQVEWLMKPAGARFALLTGSPRASSVSAIQWSDLGLTVRVLRGSKMHTTQGLLDETAAALQFPYYFGENWDAFSECLSDLSWIHAGSGYVIIFRDAHLVLSAEPSDELQILVGILNSVADEWAESVSLGEYWDHEPVPFTPVLHVSPQLAEASMGRWAAAGASIAASWAGTLDEY